MQPWLKKYTLFTQKEECPWKITWRALRNNVCVNSAIWLIKIRLIGYDKDLSLISIAGLGFGFELKQGFLYYAHFSIGSDSDSDPLIEMYVLGTEICP